MGKKRYTSKTPVGSKTATPPKVVTASPALCDKSIENENSRAAVKLQLDSADESFLLNSIENGTAILILGAGASANSRTARGEPVKVARQLAQTFAQHAGLPYQGESLTDVFGAIRGQILSDAQITRVLNEEYKGITPSAELKSLFKFVWKRVYTWNIDDTIENCTGDHRQTRRYYNALIDKAAEFEDLNILHVIHLHGDIVKPEHGFIITEAEYANAVKRSDFYWYQRLAQDYIAHCPIFIGSTIEEPILAAELERAKRDGSGVSGKAFLITPDALSPIKTSSLKAKGIVHVKATLEDFATWLIDRFPSGTSPTNIIFKTNQYPDSALDIITKRDLETASSIYPILSDQLTTEVRRKTSIELAHLARQFLRGFPPTWAIVASDIPVALENNRALFASLSYAVENHSKLFVVAGQAGSGKTTATMMCLIKYVNENPNVKLFEIRRDVRSMAAAFTLLKRLHDGPCLAYVGDLLVYGDAFKQDLEVLTGNQVTVISTARLGEWNDRLVRHLGSITKPTIFQRFTSNDYNPLIDRLLKYLPSPKFRKLARSEQQNVLKKSKSQLLIALKEATESENFTEIITHEFEGLHSDTKMLFLIVGVGTIARIGIRQEMAKEAYSTLLLSKSYNEALAALEGIVAPSEGGRLYARHELYVRHIIENVIHFSEFRSALCAILRTYLKFEIPIVKSVTRLDAQLFRFLLNYRFILDNAERHNQTQAGIEFYSEFEVDFQLDGHFWLQYGLYLANLGTLSPAIKMLRRSIEAYPQNPFAAHALADVQLRAAKERAAYDLVTRELISDAVKALTLQDSQFGLELDEYPIVTLANGHVAALDRHNQPKLAQDFARQYFDRLQQIEKRSSSPSIKKTKERMLRYATFGEFQEKPTRPARKVQPGGKPRSA